MDLDRRPIVITGAAGLVGQNLIPRLKARHAGPLIAIDKHPANTRTLARLHPDIRVIEADLAVDGAWREAFIGARALVLNHAQIGALNEAPFIANNVTATRNVLAAAKAGGVGYIVHVSSSVLNSAARDFYTETKREQEALVVESAIPSCILRPTLMYGWFDRKHLGWLARFMQKAPLFPIPGSGRYLRQPLYVGDVCDIIIACIEQRPVGKIYNISGQERIDYIDLIRALKKASGARAPIVPIPYALFWTMLYVYGLIDRDPPFTTKQLEALATPDIFEVIDWPKIFGIKATPLNAALAETYQHPTYSQITLEF